MLGKESCRRTWRRCVGNGRSDYSGRRSKDTVAVRLIKAGRTIEGSHKVYGVNQVTFGRRTDLCEGVTDALECAVLVVLEAGMSECDAALS